MLIKHQNRKMKNLGQVTVEYILLAVVLIVMFQLAGQTLRSSGYLNNFQEIPNAMLKNLIENGNWNPDEDESRRHHPNHHFLHYTPYGEGP